MTTTDHLKRVGWLYHFTDSRNLRLIRELNGLWSTAKLREMGIEFYSGGNEHSLDADQMFGMDEYVHLCFTTKHPMAYLATKDGRIEKFNPYRSINCQARSCALFLSLMKRNLLDEATLSPEDFLSTLLRFNYRPQLRAERHNQDPLF
jgi:hypothetical protein